MQCTLQRCSGEVLLLYMQYISNLRYLFFIVDGNAKRQTESDPTQIILPPSFFESNEENNYLYLVRYSEAVLFPLSERLLDNNFTVASPVLGISVVGRAENRFMDQVSYTLPIRNEVIF